MDKLVAGWRTVPLKSVAEFFYLTLIVWYSIRFSQIFSLSCVANFAILIHNHI